MCSKLTMKAPQRRHAVSRILLLIYSANGSWNKNSQNIFHIILCPVQLLLYNKWHKLEGGNVVKIKVPKNTLFSANICLFKINNRSSVSIVDFEQLNNWQRLPNPLFHNDPLFLKLKWPFSYSRLTWSKPQASKFDIKRLWRKESHAFDTPIEIVAIKPEE